MVDIMTIKELIELSALTQAEFAKKYNIPKRTIESWVMGERTPPKYVVELLEKTVKRDLS